MNVHLITDRGFILALKANKLKDAREVIRLASRQPMSAAETCGLRGDFQKGFQLFNSLLRGTARVRSSIYMLEFPEVEQEKMGRHSCSLSKNFYMDITCLQFMLL